jgi:hypothetical protein
MKKSTLLYLLAMILGLLSLLLTVSSVMLWLVFPRGFYGVRVLWADIHKWGGLALGVGVLLHVLLHWKWLVQKTRRYLGLRPRREARTSTGPAEVAAQPEPN